MSQTHYPSVEDLEAWLTAANLSAALIATLDMETAVAAGRNAFEERVGRRMLAVPQTREFDPPSSTNPRGVIDLKADLVSVTSCTLAGSALTLGTDYRLLPPNARDDGRPYTMLQFPVHRNIPYTWVGTTWLSLTGLWGFDTVIPDAAWVAMLAAAGLALFPVIAQARSLGLDSWHEADMQENYGSDPLGSLRKNWTATLDGPTMMFARVEQG